MTVEMTTDWIVATVIVVGFIAVVVSGGFAYSIDDSRWHLLWIVPVSIVIAALLVAVVIAVLLFAGDPTYGPGSQV